MNKGIMFILGSVAGAAAGSFITYKYLDEKYRRLADEEIASVRAVYNSKLEEKENTTIDIPEEYSDLVEDLGYSTDETEEDPYEIYVEPGIESVEPYVISPEEYGEVYDYDKKSWTHYIDGIVTDETGEIVDDLDNVIGDALSHFGEYEDDAVHVRNQDLGWDIEILRHNGTYSETNGVDI